MAARAVESSRAEPMRFPLSKNHTVPVGGPPDPVTVAVSVTGCPAVDLLGALVSAVDADAAPVRFTRSNTTGEVLPAKVASPLYWAVTRCPPGGGATESVARPAVSGAEPSEVDPSKKVTAPAGAPPADVTVAVKVTEAGAVTGFRDARSKVADGTLVSDWVKGGDALARKLEEPP